MSSFTFFLLIIRYFLIFFFLKKINKLHIQCKVSNFNKSIEFKVSVNINQCTKLN